MGSILSASVFHNNLIVAFPVAYTLVLMLLDGEGAPDELAKLGRAVEFLEDQYRHCKTIFVMDASSILLDKAGIEGTLPKGKAEPGLILSEPAADVAAAFIDAIAKHRQRERECEPPLV